MSRRKYVYGGVPMVHHSRSKFDLSYGHKSTMNVGDLVPLYCQEVYPGDSFKCDARVLTRVTSSFLKPVMDNLFLDVMFFFVPSRTVFDNWAEIFGENNSSAWARTTSVSAPLLNGGASSDTTVVPHSIASYLGLPIGSSVSNFANGGGVNVLPFRAYAKIYNEWYRDENLVDPVNLQTGDAGVQEVLNSDAFSADNYTGLVAKVSKLHDYFTQLLPDPQKGDAVSIGSSVFPSLQVPVVTSSTQFVDASAPLTFSGSGGNQIGSDSSPLSLVLPYRGSHLSRTLSGYFDETASTGDVDLVPNNLFAQIPQTSLASVSVNDLRLAFQTQKMLERDAIYGTRFTEYIQGHFGVTSPDARLQRSEFLGGRRLPLFVFQATQTSEATSSSPLGNVAGWSLSSGRSGYTKGFTEHGFVIGMFCIRQFHTYQQGVEKFWWRKNRLDYLDPLFTSIGYQPVYTKEVYCADGVGTSVFGYAPAFEDLRCRQNRVSGMLATASSEGLDIWHFGDNYSSQPILGQEWIEETSTYVDRTLSVPSTTVDQFIVDVWFKQYAIRVMPTYGEPGLIDHH